jgi:hypothetical protein
VSRRRLVGLLAATALVASGASALAAPAAAPAGAPVEASLLGEGTFHAFVQYSRPVTEADVAALRDLGIAQLRPFKIVNAVAVIAPTLPLQRAAGLPGVTGVQRDNGLRMDMAESKKAIKADQARAPKPKGMGLTGKGVTVAVIDSGLDTSHPGLRRPGADVQLRGRLDLRPVPGRRDQRLRVRDGRAVRQRRRDRSRHPRRLDGGRQRCRCREGHRAPTTPAFAPEVEFVGLKVASARRASSTTTGGRPTPWPPSST